MVVLWWCNGVTAVLQQCYSGVTLVLQWCYSSVTLVLQDLDRAVQCLLTEHALHHVLL
jgi:hypothetical protein